MAVVLVLNRERHAAAMTRWSVHFARGRGESLHILAAKGEAEEYASAEPEESSLWKEVETALGPNSKHDEADSSKVSVCLLYTSPSPRDRTRSRMPSSA